MSTPSSPDQIAQQILDATRVLSDASTARPGKPVTLQVLPGFSPSLPATSTLNNVHLASVTGAINPINADLTGVINTLVDAVSVTVSYAVKNADGTPAGAADFISKPPLTPGGPDPLTVAFLLKPDVADDISHTTPRGYVITVSIAVKVEGASKNVSIDVPIALPAIQIPTLCLLGKHANFATYDGDDPGKLVVLARSGAPANTLNQVFNTVNELMDTFESVRSVLDFGANFSNALRMIADIVDKAPTVYFHEGNASALDDFGDFDDDASSMLLIGVKGTKFTLYKDSDFEKGGVDEEYKVFTVDDVIVNGVDTGVGVKLVPNFAGISYDTDPGDEINDSTESARFGGI